MIEALKNKRKNSEIFPSYVYTEEDVRSAVKYLKENIQIEQEGEFIIKVKDVNKLIDEAFEDVK